MGLDAQILHTRGRPVMMMPLTADDSEFLTQEIHTFPKEGHDSATDLTGLMSKLIQRRVARPSCIYPDPAKIQQPKIQARKTTLLTHPIMGHSCKPRDRNSKFKYAGQFNYRS
jgi:hypothetical protein